MCARRAVMRDPAAKEIRAMPQMFHFLNVRYLVALSCSVILISPGHLHAIKLCTRWGPEMDLTLAGAAPARAVSGTIQAESSRQPHRSAWKSALVNPPIRMLLRLFSRSTMHRKNFLLA